MGTGTGEKEGKVGKAVEEKKAGAGTESFEGWIAAPKSCGHFCTHNWFEVKGGAGEKKGMGRWANS